MNYYKFYENLEGMLNHGISSLSFREKFIFGLFCLKRNEANYHYFSVKENFNDPFLLIQIRNEISKLVNLDVKNIELAEGLMSELIKENAVPHSEDYNDATLAIDACSIAFDLLKFYIDEDDKRIIRIGLTSIEVVEKWIYESFGYIEDKDYEFDTKILSYQLMKDEIDSQNKILTLLEGKKLLDITEEIKNTNISNIGVKI